MCITCGTQNDAKPRVGRRKLWELTGGWHCAIIGTCLTLEDLRILARKLSVKTKPGFNPDYQLHAYFVQSAAAGGTASKMLNKLLDRRHSGAVRRARDLRTVEELAGFWRQSLEEGAIPGPYWALVSHPKATDMFCEQMFADVHMLSHLVGASNRADVKRLTDLEGIVESLQTEVERQKTKRQLLAERKNRQLDSLRRQISGWCARETEASADHPRECEWRKLSDHNARLLQTINTLRADLDTLRARESAMTGRLETLEAENARLADEAAAVEAQMNERWSQGDDRPAYDLQGRRVLYVGGRHHVTHTIRSIVQGWNGSFLHHDGGLERSMDELARAVSKADAVVFPVDCVSHGAITTVKKLCTQSRKPYYPLRSSGVASFLSAFPGDVPRMEAKV